VKLRSNINSIKALRENDRWVVSPCDVRKVVVDYFTNHVSATPMNRPKLDGVPFDRLSAWENEVLVTPFSLEEIESVVRDSDGNKSLGHDGYNSCLLKNFGI